MVRLKPRYKFKMRKGNSSRTREKQFRRRHYFCFQFIPTQRTCVVWLIPTHSNLPWHISYVASTQFSVNRHIFFLNKFVDHFKMLELISFSFPIHTWLTYSDLSNIFAGVSSAIWKRILIHLYEGILRHIYNIIAAGSAFE